MKMIKRIWVLFIFIMFLALPLMAQEAAENTGIAETDTDETGLEENLEAIETTDEGVTTALVYSVDLNGGALTIGKNHTDQKTFYVIDGETILWRGIEDIELSDIKVGEEAEVGFYKNDAGKLIASWVDVLVEEEMPSEEAEQDLTEGEETE